MPHFTIEYSANLNARVDMDAVAELVRKAAVETGIFPLGGIRATSPPARRPASISSRRCRPISIRCSRR